MNSRHSESQTQRLLRLLSDGRWHYASQCIRAMRGYRLSSAVYRLRKLKHEIRVVVNQTGRRVTSAYRLAK